MALSVEFAIADGLNNALVELRTNLSKYRGIVVIVDKETLTSGSDLFVASENLDADFAQLRAGLAGKEAALIALSVDGRLTLVTFTPQDIKPRQRMIYAASSSRLRDHAKIVGDTHISAVDELTPKLFGHKESDRVALRSEAEVQKDKIAEMQAKDLKDGPQRAHAMHSMSTTLSGDALAATKAAIGGESTAAVLAIRDGAIVVDGSVAKDQPLESVEVPADEPRFVVLRRDQRTVLAYIVPDGCKPKVRMQYATTKASLVSELKKNSIDVDRSVECDSAAALPRKIELTFTAPVEDGGADAEAEAPAKKAFMKGPRMFMPGQ
eukprot:CAMPEP_0174860524 /NCGR_PEP_ID=MMETSP1114-20130205/49392_1 /TAXON_ID=312471 /ORGANISM="Neobodo designis, Strain CCAP 1951/1" /LENGTH=322 /DNA_ID=CAMNT_0016095501 /DNA_START=30 /DNA_END=998 /DNA_ORIENTATION=-